MRDAAKKEGRTVLYVSHNMNTIRQLCDRCVVLDQGRIVFEGDVESAVQKYLGVTDNTSCEYLFTDNFHSDSRSTKEFQIHSLKIEDTTEPVFSPNGSVNLTIRCHAKAKYENVFLRFEVQTPSGIPIGIMLSENNFNICNEDKSLKLSLNLSHLVTGKYQVNIIAYTVDEFGAECFIDGVYPGMVFDIVDTTNSIVWLPQYWGYVKLHNIHFFEEWLGECYAEN